jgi:hypothetical protein
VSLLDRLRSFLGRSSDLEAAPTAEDQRLDAMSAAALHNRNPVMPSGGLPPPGYVKDDEGRPRT